MKIVKPDFYDRFQCLAGACPDSCCHEWEVDVDEAAAQSYLALQGDLGSRLRHFLRQGPDGWAMTLENGRCPMWRQDGLCQIQAQLGHDALCKTCREFPRLRHDFGDYVELGLELSCPEAARVLFSPYCFTEETCPGGEADYDKALFSLLLSTRQKALAFWESGQMSIGKKLAVLLLYAYDVQAAIDGDTLPPFQPETLLRSAEKFALPGDISGFYPFFLDLELLTQRWQNRLENPAKNAPLQEQLGYLAKYLLCRYWLRALYDGELTVWVKFILIGCLLVNALGGDMPDTAQLFSKEIENDPDNLDAILDAVYAEPAFTDGNLLGLLLKK